MNYELAKLLKEAGFPQDGYGHYLEPKERIGLEVAFKNTAEAAYAPSLGELIDACGFDFRDLSQHSPRSSVAKPGWLARGGKRIFGHWVLSGGHTPHEAVAKLWLKLHRNVSRLSTPESC